MSRLVWDSSAVLLVLNQEPGWQGLLDLLPDGVLCAVNCSEVAGKLAESGMRDVEVEQVIGALPLSVEAFTEEDAVAAGVLRPSTRQSGLSLGDRACLALGSRLGLTVLTADRAWERLDVGPPVRLAR